MNRVLKRTLLPLAVAELLLSSALSAAAAQRENWAGATSPYFQKLNSRNEIATRTPSAGSNDNNTARMRLKARPGAGPDAGIQISTYNARRLGDYSTRLKCTGRSTRTSGPTG